MSALDALARRYLRLAVRAVLRVERELEREKLTLRDLARMEREVRAASGILAFSVPELREELARLARAHGGCVSCARSAPDPAELSLTARVCALGLRARSRCSRYSPLA